MTKLGRKPVFENSRNVADALRKVENGEGASRYLKQQLVEKGYLETAPVKTGSRGRPRVNYALTGKGRGYLALAKNWKKA